MNPNLKKTVKISGVSIFFILIVIYTILGSKDLIFGVKIRNISMNDLPAQSGATVAENIIKISGNAKNAISLTLDGREISIDKQGNFSETIALLSGYNIVSIKARDKFEYADEKNYQIMYKKQL